MEDETSSIVVVEVEAVPAAVREWLQQLGQEAILASLEVLADGRLALQTIPGVDPRLVARVRRTIGQYEDVLRRLS